MMPPTDLEKAKELMANPLCSLWYFRYLWAGRIIAEAACARRLAANSPWEEKTDGKHDGARG